MTNNFLLYTSFSQIHFIEKECEAKLTKFDLNSIKGARSFIRLALFDISGLDLLLIPEKKLPIIKLVEQKYKSPESLFELFELELISELKEVTSYKITIHNHLDELLPTREIEAFLEAKIPDKNYVFNGFEVHLRFDFFEEEIILVKEFNSVEIKENVATGMKLQLARSFVLEANLNDTSRVLEPFMGSGKIIEETKRLYPNSEVVGVERRAIPFNKTKEKFKEQKGVKLLNDNFYNLEFLGEFDAIISDPPYGIQLNRHVDYNVFYEKLFKKASELLVDGGRLVIGAARTETFERKLENQNDLKLKEKWPFITGKIRANLYIIVKENS